jgi:hypothetical protein
LLHSDSILLPLYNNNNNNNNNNNSENMKIISNCTLLAAALSAKYRTYNDFQPLSVEKNDDRAVTATSSRTWATEARNSPHSSSATSFSSYSSLEEFLDENGILLTMCMKLHGLVPKWECSGPSQGGSSSSTTTTTTATTTGGKISASWIQVNKTNGFRVVKPPVDVGPPVGFILKPTAFSIQCIYPMGVDHCPMMLGMVPKDMIRKRIGFANI